MQKIAPTQREAFMDGVQLTGESLKLLRLAEKQFGKSWKPTWAERIVLAAVTTDEPADCVPSELKDEKEKNPEHGNVWSHERTVKADLIRWLCTNRQALDLVDPSGFEINGAKIVDGLNLQDLTIPFALSLTYCFIPEELVVYSSEISSLRLDGSWVNSLNANGIRTKGDLSLRNGFRSQGMVQLIDARIGGQVDCTGGQFINLQRKGVSTSGIALTADGIVISGSLFLKEKFRAEGKVRLVGAQVGGNVECVRGEFINPAEENLSERGVAIVADSISVKGSVFLRAHCEGEVRLLDARIGADLECNGASFINPEKRSAETELVDNSGNSLSLHRSIIDGDLFLTDKFRAEGAVNLRGARIGGNIHCSLGDFTKADLWLENTTATFFGDFESHWPRQNHLHVNRFEYQMIYPLNADMRLNWLQLQSDNVNEPFYRQPYLQLAKVLANAGDEEGRIKVLIALKDKEWTVARRGLFAQVWRWPFRVTAGYGYDPLQALWQILGLNALGWIIYRRSYLAGGVAPSEREAYTDFKTSGQPPAHYTKFSPLLYSLENSLPLVKLGQAGKWEPDPSPQICPAAPVVLNSNPKLKRLQWLHKILSFVGIQPPDNTASPHPRVNHFGTSSKFVRWFLWIQILLGWLLATVFLAGISGIIKKE